MYKWTCNELEAIIDEFGEQRDESYQQNNLHTFFFLASAPFFSLASDSYM